MKSGPAGLPMGMRNAPAGPTPIGVNGQQVPPQEAGGHAAPMIATNAPDAVRHDPTGNDARSAKGHLAKAALRARMGNDVPSAKDHPGKVVTDPTGRAVPMGSGPGRHLVAGDHATNDRSLG